MKIACAQYVVKRSDPAFNLRTIREFVVQTKNAGARALFLPEMCTTGFAWKKYPELAKAEADTITTISDIAKTSQIAICGSFLEQSECAHPANTLFYFNRSGELAAKYRKVHLFTLFGEEKYIEPGNAIITANTDMGIIGCSICYDLRFPELFRECALDGAQIQILPAAFPHPRLEHWRTLVRARAIENQCFFIATNQCGKEVHSSEVGETHYFGHSMIVNPWGEILAEADESEGLIFADIDISVVDETRNQLTALNDRRPDLY
jgi:omega-amidase